MHSINAGLSQVPMTKAGMTNMFMLSEKDLAHLMHFKQVWLYVAVSMW